MSRLNTAAKSGQLFREVTAGAAARLQDVDMAEETALLVRNQIAQNIGVTVLANIWENAGLMLNLLR